MAACQRIHAQSLLFCLLLPSYLVFRFSPFSETPRLRFKNSLTSGKWVDSLASIKEHGWSGESAKGWMKKLISESTLLFLVEKTGIGMKMVKALDKVTPSAHQDTSPSTGCSVGTLFEKYRIMVLPSRLDLSGRKGAGGAPPGPYDILGLGPHLA